MHDCQSMAPYACCLTSAGYPEPWNSQVNQLIKQLKMWDSVGNLRRSVQQHQGSVRHLTSPPSDVAQLFKGTSSSALPWPYSREAPPPPLHVSCFWCSYGKTSTLCFFFFFFWGGGGGMGVVLIPFCVRNCVHMCALRDSCSPNMSRTSPQCGLPDSGRSPRVKSRHPKLYRLVLKGLLVDLVYHSHSIIEFPWHHRRQQYDSSVADS